MPTFEAQIGDRRFNFTYQDEVLHLNGNAVSYSFIPLGTQTYSLILDGKSQTLVVEVLSDGLLRVTDQQGRRTDVRVKDEATLLLEQFGLNPADNQAEKEIRAPMPGLVLDVLVTPTQHVEAGAGLVVLEAMKMENELRAPAAATVHAVHVQPGDAVGKNDILITFD